VLIKFLISISLLFPYFPFYTKKNGNRAGSNEGKSLIGDHKGRSYKFMNINHELHEFTRKLGI